MTMIQTGRPAPGSLTGRVWEIADEIYAAEGRLPRGREVVDAYLGEDPSRNSGTGFTQYSHWKKAREGGLPSAEHSDDARIVTVRSQGEISLPLDLLHALGVKVGDRLVVSQESGSLRLMSPSAALTHARKIVRAFDKGHGSPVDELLGERRRESTL